MSMITPPPAPPYGDDPKAAAAAAKAYAKAQRPWFKKKRFILPLIVVAAVALASAGAGGGDETSESTSDRQDVGPETASGNTSNPPQADLNSDIECVTDATTGWVSANGTLTNHSSETSSYMISVSFNDASGTRFEESTAFNNDVRSGETAVWNAAGINEAPGDGWTCAVVSVERFAS